MCLEFAQVGLVVVVLDGLPPSVGPGVNVVGFLTELEPRQADLLGNVLAAELIQEDVLEAALNSREKQRKLPVRQLVGDGDSFR